MGRRRGVRRPRPKGIGVGVWGGFGFWPRTASHFLRAPGLEGDVRLLPCACVGFCAIARASWPWRRRDRGRRAGVSTGKASDESRAPRGSCALDGRRRGWGEGEREREEAEEPKGGARDDQLVQPRRECRYSAALQHTCRAALDASDAAAAARPPDKAPPPWWLRLGDPTTCLPKKSPPGPPAATETAGLALHAYSSCYSGTIALGAVHVCAVAV